MVALLCSHPNGAFPYPDRPLKNSGSPIRGKLSLTPPDCHFRLPDGLLHSKPFKFGAKADDPFNFHHAIAVLLKKVPANLTRFSMNGPDTLGPRPAFQFSVNLGRSATPSLRRLAINHGEMIDGVKLAESDNAAAGLGYKRDTPAQPLRKLPPIVGRTCPGINLCGRVPLRYRHENRIAEYPGHRFDIVITEFTQNHWLSSEHFRFR
jgi:hypothetical protein